jgi:hypothetical protein
MTVSERIQQFVGLTGELSSAESYVQELSMERARIVLDIHRQGLSYGDISDELARVGLGLTRGRIQQLCEKAEARERVVVKIRS